MNFYLGIPVIRLGAILCLINLLSCNNAKEIALDASKPLGMLIDQNISTNLAGGGGGSTSFSLQYDSSTTLGEGVVTDIALSLSANPGSPGAIYDFTILSGPSSAVLQITTLNFPDTVSINLPVQIGSDDDCLNHDLKIQATRRSDSANEEILVKVVDSDYCMFVARNWSRKDPAASNPSGYTGDFKSLHPSAPNGITAADLECGTEKDFKFPEYSGDGTKYKAMLASYSPSRSLNWGWAPMAANRRYVAKWEVSGYWKPVFLSNSSLPPKNFGLSETLTNSASDYGAAYWTGMTTTWHYMGGNTCESTSTFNSWESAESGVSGSKGQTGTTNSGAISGINGDCSTMANLICVESTK